MCLSVSPVCVYVCAPCECLVPDRSEEGIKSHVTEGRHGCVMGTCLQEQQVLLNTEPSFQSLVSGSAREFMLLSAGQLHPRMTKLLCVNPPTSSELRGSQSLTGNIKVQSPAS